LTLREAADRVGIRPATLRQAIARGSLRATKVGRDWHVTQRQLDAWRATGGRWRKGLPTP